MANPLYEMMSNRQPAQTFFPSPAQNPVMRMQYLMQALQNPAAFVQRMIPDIPQNIINDPNRILQYLKETRGISDEQIRQIAGQIPRF